MKEGDKLKTNALRMALSAVKYIEIEKKRELDDEETIGVLSTLGKQRRESIEQFKKGNRPDLVEKDKKKFEDLKRKDKPFFDSERLVNPYSDTRVLYGDPEREVKTALVGIDMEGGEILPPERLKQKGVPIDLVIAHHPEGRAMSALSDVMGMQSAILVKYGLPVHVAEDLMDERIKEVERRLLPANHTRAVDAARLLDVPFMCVHTPADNAVATYLQKFLDDKKPVYVSDVLDSLREIPEYKGASGETIGPRLVTGSDKRRAGKIFVDMTGGTR